MTPDPATGVWSIDGHAGLERATSTSTRSRCSSARPATVEHEPGDRSVLGQPVAQQPPQPDRRSRRPGAGCRRAGAASQKPPLRAPEDIVLYELHVRDFSASDPSVPEALRGTFKAFTARLARHAPPARPRPGGPHPRPPAAGLRHRHDRRGQVAVAGAAGDLSGLPAGLRPAAGGGRGRRRRRTPSTGATTPGTTRCPRAATHRPGRSAPGARVPRRWSRALNQPGLRVVMDVVYNHTTASGPEREVRARPHRARLLPPAQRATARSSTAPAARTPPASTT